MFQARKGTSSTPCPWRLLRLVGCFKPARVHPVRGIIGRPPDPRGGFKPARVHPVLDELLDPPDEPPPVSSPQGYIQYIPTRKPRPTGWRFKPARVHPVLLALAAAAGRLKRFKPARVHPVLWSLEEIDADDLTDGVSSPQGYIQYQSTIATIGVELTFQARKGTSSTTGVIDCEHSPKQFQARKGTSSTVGSLVLVVVWCVFQARKGTSSTATASVPPRAMPSFKPARVHPVPTRNRVVTHSYRLFPLKDFRRPPITPKPPGGRLKLTQIETVIT